MSFLIPFLTTLVAELGDKSFMTLTYLAAKTPKHVTIFTAALSAFLVLNSLTAFAGAALRQYMNFDILKIVAGIVFIAFGIAALLLKERKEGHEALKTSDAFRYTFGLVILSELGDRTNIATGAFATQYNPWLVLAGVILAEAIMMILAIQIGKWISKKIPHERIAHIGGLLFIGVGILILATR